MPLISVVIPAYNAQKTIRQTIQSVLNQTFPDLELIVINDGSTDSTLDIISSVQDPRLKVFSYPNSGPQKSRNRGISHAVGEFIAFLDADDLWLPDKLEAQLKALQENPQAAVAYSWTDWVDEQGVFIHRGSYSTIKGDVFAQLLLRDFIESGSNPLIRKLALDEVGEFDESLVGGQDWDMWLRLSARYPFVVVPSVHILYRQSPNSWSTNVARQETGFKRVIEKALNSAPESIKSLRKDIISNRYKCLTVDALEGLPKRQNGLIATRFLWTAFINDPSLLKARVIIKIIFKILIFILLPPQLAKNLLTQAGSLADVKPLYGYLKLDYHDA